MCVGPISPRRTSKKRSASFAGESASTARRMRDALGPRVLSGVVLAAVALLATHIGGVAFQVVVASAALLLVWEWDRLVGGSGFGLVPAILAVFGMAALVAMSTGDIVVTAFMVIAGAALAAVTAWWTRRSWAWAVAGSALVAVAAVRRRLASC